MMRIAIFCLALAATAMGQASGKTSQSPPAQPGPTTQTNPSTGAPTLHTRNELPPPVPDDEAVITVRGLCSAETRAANKPNVPSTQDCLIKVTKKQFDDLVKAVNPNNQPIPQPQLLGAGGKAYVDLLIFAEAAKADGRRSTPPICFS